MVALYEKKRDVYKLEKNKYMDIINSMENNIMQLNSKVKSLENLNESYKSKNINEYIP